MDNSALIDSFTEFKDFKKIDRLPLTAILEEVFRTALKKKYGTDDNFNIVVNPDKGEMCIKDRPNCLKSFKGFCMVLVR